jgi:hypothetical protein
MRKSTHSWPFVYRPPTGRGSNRAMNPRKNPALVVALVALVAAMGGSAAALPGSGSIDRNDVKKNAIRSKAIKNGQVKGVDIAQGAVRGDQLADGTVDGSDIADGGVGTADIADGTVRPSDLAPTELYHLVGAPDEPQFFDGGEGDCVWTSGLENAPGTAPIGFAKDALGRVRLRGIGTATAGPGGDQTCNPDDPGEAEDGLVFVLPPAYRPGFFDVSGLAHALVVAPDAGAKLNDNPIPPGGVLSVIKTNAVLDGVMFDAATGAAGATARPNVSLQALKNLSN